jgi:phosphoglycolate phosphatase (TIGR01487 family)
MPRRVRWVVTDIDGTITNQLGMLDLGVLRELRRLEETGIRVGLVSGRPYPMIRMLGEYLGLTGPLIAENGGAYIWLDQTFQLGYRDVAEKAARELGKRISIQPTWDNQWRLTDFAINPTVSVDELKRLVAVLPLDIELHVSSIMIHLGKSGVDKGIAVELCMTQAGLENDEIIVSGDASSDLSLFERFKLSIAPANSCESIIDNAGFCAEGLFAQGFRQGIQHYRKLGFLP